MSVTEEFLAHNEVYASTFDGPLPFPPPAGRPSSPAWTRG